MQQPHYAYIKPGGENLLQRTTPPARPLRPVKLAAVGPNPQVRVSRDERLCVMRDKRRCIKIQYVRSRTPTISCM